MEYVVECDGCVYWKRLNPQEGHCIRRAPHPWIVPTTPEMRVDVYWPKTLPTEGCGDGVSYATEER